MGGLRWRRGSQEAVSCGLAEVTPEAVRAPTQSLVSGAAQASVQVLSASHWLGDVGQVTPPVELWAPSSDQNGDGLASGWRKAGRT